MRLYKSELADAPIPQDVSLTELLLTSARSPSVPESHVIAKDKLEGRALTLGQLRDRAGRLAQGLTTRYRPRDQSRWAIILPNSVTILEAVHAVLWLGGVACPINHQLKAGEIAHAFSISKPEFVIAYSEIIDKVEEAISLARTKYMTAVKEAVVIVAIEQNKPGAQPYPFLSSFLATERLPVHHHPDTRKRLASIHLSSGTTGQFRIPLLICHRIVRTN